MRVNEIEVFVYNDKFYYEIGDLLDDYDIENPQDIEDDMSFTIYPCQLEPLVTLSADWIMDRIDEERFSEEGDESEKVADTLLKYIDFEKVNSMMPKMYYPIGPKYILTKKDIIEYCS